MFKWNKFLKIQKFFFSRKIFKKIKNNENSNTKFDDNFDFETNNIYLKYLNYIKETESTNQLNFNNKSSFNQKLSFDEFKQQLENELSDEEFSSEASINFKRPPLTFNEIKKTIEESDSIYNENKYSLFDNPENGNDSEKIDKTSKEYEKILNEFIENKPEHFKLISLNYPVTDTNIILCGIKKASNKHSVYLNKLLKFFNPETVLLQIYPDHPYFISAGYDYETAWKEFIRTGENIQFLVNPKPENISDILISQRKIEKIFDENFDEANEIKITPKFVFSKQKLLNQETFLVDSFLSSMYQIYKNRNDNFIPIVCCDFPYLAWVEFVCSKMNVKALRNIMMQYIKDISEEKFHSDHRLIDYKNYSRHRVKYITEVLRQSCFSSKNIYLICDYNLTDKIIKEWYDLPEKMQKLNSFYIENMETEQKKDSFEEYMEKLVIIDLLNDEMIHKYFVEYKNFPFSGKNTTTWEVNFTMLFMLWSHYRSHYIALLKNVVIKSGSYREYLEEFNYNVEETEYEMMFNDKQMLNDKEKEEVDGESGDKEGNNNGNLQKNDEEGKNRNEYYGEFEEDDLDYLEGDKKFK